MTVLIALSVAGYVLANRFEPYVRTQAIPTWNAGSTAKSNWLPSECVCLEFSPLRVLFRRGRGVVAAVEGDGVLLRHKGRRDISPMFSMKKVSIQRGSGGTS